MFSVLAAKTLSKNYILPVTPSSDLHSQADLVDSKHPQSSDSFWLLDKRWAVKQVQTFLVPQCQPNSCKLAISAPGKRTMFHSISPFALSRNLQSRINRFSLLYARATNVYEKGPTYTPGDRLYIQYSPPVSRRYMRHRKWKALWGWFGWAGRWPTAGSSGPLYPVNTAVNTSGTD